MMKATIKFARQVAGAASVAIFFATPSLALASPWLQANDVVDYVSLINMSLFFEDAYWLMPDGTFFRQKTLPHGPARKEGTVYSCKLSSTDLANFRALIEHGNALEAVSDNEYSRQPDLGAYLLYMHSKSGLQKSKFIYAATDNADFNALIHGFVDVKCADHLVIKGNVPMHWRPESFPKDLSDRGPPGQN